MNTESRWFNTTKCLELIRLNAALQFITPQNWPVMDQTIDKYVNAFYLLLRILLRDTEVMPR